MDKKIKNASRITINFMLYDTSNDRLKFEFVLRLVLPDKIV